jgi:hypothetical protein
MRSALHRILVAAATLAASVASAQTHKVAKPEQVVRAVGVYEWTGDFAKPTASRLIPVSVYIEGKFEDAGVYTARPVPFALLSGNVYILQSAGIDKGTLDLAYAKHLQAVESTGDLAYDDGWFGYGSVKPLAAPRNTTHALKPSKNVPAIAISSDPNRPHLVTKNSGTTSGDTASSTSSDPSKSGTSTTPSTTTGSTTDPTTSGTKSTATGDDADRPTMKRRDNSGSTTTASNSPSVTSAGSASDDPDRPTMKRRDTSGTTSSDTDSSTASTQTGSTPADDPDRPTMKRHDPSTGTTSSGSDTSDTSTTTASAPSNSPDDPDRPTLKRRSAADAQRTGTNTSVPAVSAVGSLNDDPNRPNLHHGKPVSAMNETDLPKLTGLPPNLHQMVAVSDAVNRDSHPFALAWDDEAQHQAILTKIQEMAHAQLAAYSPLAPTTPPPAAKRAPATPTRTKKPAAPPPPPLLDEDLKAYTLSYGGSPTYVYSANTGGTGAALRYVTIVAQDDGLGNIKPAIQSVTDAAHLDRTPKMQFVDVVDAEASNRASLLFELRSHSVRQFALYRVIASHPEQIFLTGTTQ